MKRKSHVIGIFVCCCLITFALPQNSLGHTPKKLDHVFTASDRDYWPTDGWRNTTPEEQSMISEDIDDMIDYFVEEDIAVHSVVIVKNGYVVCEADLGHYYNVSKRHPLHSVTKSFTSTLMGIAIDQGYVEDVSQTVLSYFPDYEIANVDARRERITIENLLTMRSGMDWNETGTSYLSPENDVSHILFGDGVAHSLNLDMVAEPGEIWHYNGGASHLLAAIVQVATETNLLDFATEHLFEPLGIDSKVWSRDGSGIWYTGAWGLELSPRSLAKFGYLFLNNGEWDGEQIISENWVETATSSFTDLDMNQRFTPSSQGYGYQWWTNPDLGTFYAAGRNGQFIVVVPDQDIVAVFTSGINEGNTELPLYAFENYILHYDEILEVRAVQNTIINGVIIAVIVVTIVAIGLHRMKDRKST